MRWELIYVFTALVAATSAQSHTIDNGIIVVQPALVTDIPTDHNITDSDGMKHNNSLNHDGSYSSEGNNDEDEKIQDVVPPLARSSSSSSSESSASSRQTREAGESKHGSNESPPVDTDTPDGENASADKNTHEEDSTTKPPELDDSTENASTTKSKEGKGSAEILSAEKSDTEDSSTPLVGASNEGVSGQNSQAVTEVDTDVVETTHGPVKGFQWQDTEIIGFYDIPYGTFEKPFEPSVSAESWTDIGVHEATQHTKTCPQIQNNEYSGDENCLTLSIFTPKNADNASVLFYIYDSDLNSKSADPLIYGPDFLVSKGVILVLPNYRIGVMGFLCMQNETAPGNAGLKDLSLALEWVKDNAQHFGGNPENIVVSGEGAAGAYAGYLALCSRTKYYIKKVITESGSAMSHWALDRNPIDTAYRLAGKLREHHADGIIFNNTFDEMALETIVKAAKNIRFMPCIEHNKDPLLEDTPWTILQNKDINATFMIGSATYAGTHEATHTTVEFMDQINKHFDLLLPEDLIFKDDDERDEFARVLREQYFGNNSITVENIEELSLWYTDAWYLSPGLRLARPLSEAGATVYLYEFAFVGALNRALEALNQPVQSAVRGDLVGYLFKKHGGAAVEDDSPEQRMIELMVDLWVSFINTGKPAAADIEWHQLKAGEDEEEEWLYISSEPVLKKGVHLERLQLWTDLYKLHFIDNSALQPAPHACLALALLICLIANNKLNYGGH